LTSIEIPLPIKTKSNEGATVIDEHVAKILRFIYNNQDFNVIKSDINESNVSILYSQAYTMKCQKLIEALDEMIVKTILTP